MCVHAFTASARIYSQPRQWSSHPVPVVTNDTLSRSTAADCSQSLPCDFARGRSIADRNFGITALQLHRQPAPAGGSVRQDMTYSLVMFSLGMCKISIKTPSQVGCVGLPLLVAVPQQWLQADASWMLCLVVCRSGHQQTECTGCNLVMMHVCYYRRPAACVCLHSSTTCCWLRIVGMAGSHVHPSCW
jgi:hypothetical protein